MSKLNNSAVQIQLSLRNPIYTFSLKKRNKINMFWILGMFFPCHDFYTLDVTQLLWEKCCQHFTVKNKYVQIIHLLELRSVCGLSRHAPISVAAQLRRGTAPARFLGFWFGIPLWAKLSALVNVVLTDRGFWVWLITPQEEPHIPLEKERHVIQTLHVKGR